MRDAAFRSAVRSKEGKREAERMTKPSRSKASLAAVYGSEVEMFMFGDVGLVIVVASDAMMSTGANQTAAAVQPVFTIGERSGNNRA